MKGYWYSKRTEEFKDLINDLHHLALWHNKPVTLHMTMPNSIDWYEVRVAPIPGAPVISYRDSDGMIIDEQPMENGGDTTKEN